MIPFYLIAFLNYFHMGQIDVDQKLFRLVAIALIDSWTKLTISLKFNKIRPRQSSAFVEGQTSSMPIQS